jgi:hypothetical protein
MTGSPDDLPASAAPQAERRLSEAAERALRMPRGKFALALHLSRLKPPSPRAYHARIARALLQDTAQRCFGQVFALRNGDLVLLCTLPAETAPRDPLSPITLASSLRGLFGADAPDDDTLTSIWRLETDALSFGTYIRERNADPANDPQRDEALGPSSPRPMCPIFWRSKPPSISAPAVICQLPPGSRPFFVNSLFRSKHWWWTPPSRVRSPTPTSSATSPPGSTLACSNICSTICGTAAKSPAGRCGKTCRFISI